MFKTILKMVLSMILGRLKNFALNAVQDLDATTLSSEEKRKAAFEKIRLAALKEGKGMRDSLINLAVEIAVQLIKKNSTSA